MKGSIGQFLRDTWRPAVGAAALGLMLVGCGDKSNDPAAETVTSLKYPGNLVINDLGNGKATLTWSGANNEEDFTGYNVYGMKLETLPAGLTEGKALELLGDDGEPNQASRDLLAKFNYDPEKKLEEAGTATDDDGKAVFSALPIHAKDGDTRLVPTCKPAAGVCGATTAANKDSTVKDDGNLAVNGTVTYTIPDDMTVGSQYCFLVLSTKKAGEVVSQTSSNITCFKPKFKATFDLGIPDTTANNVKFDITSWMAACPATGCTDPAATTPAYIAKDAGIATTGVHGSQDTAPVYVEADPIAFVAGLNSAVIDLGYYADGFTDKTLPKEAPTLVLDSNHTTAGTATTPLIFNQGGYSIAGQSVVMEAKHMYVIAVGDSSATAAVTSFHYHWIYVKAAPANGAKVAVEMRLSKAAK